jgi:hypothetical protein
MEHQAGGPTYGWIKDTLVGGTISMSSPGEPYKYSLDSTTSLLTASDTMACANNPCAAPAEADRQLSLDLGQIDFSMAYTVDHAKQITPWYLPEEKEQSCS